MTAKRYLSRIPGGIWHRLVGAMLSGIRKEIRAAAAAAEAAIGWPEKAATKVRRKPKGAKIAKRRARAA
jgi:hypothetical protein